MNLISDDLISLTSFKDLNKDKIKCVDQFDQAVKNHNQAMSTSRKMFDVEKFQTQDSKQTLNFRLKKFKKENIKINILNSPLSFKPQKLSPIVSKLVGTTKEKDWKKKQVSPDKMLNTTVFTKK